MVATIYILKASTLVHLLNIVHIRAIKGMTKVVRILSHLWVHTGAERVKASNHVVASA